MNTRAATIHQYIDRQTSLIVTERLIGDRTVAFLYNKLRENAPAMFRALTSARMSSLLGFCNYDLPGKPRLQSRKAFEDLGINWRECLEPLAYFSTMRRIFERQIRYWECRPMDDDPDIVVAPADARLLLGSFSMTSALFIKEKFFDLSELLGSGSCWSPRFAAGDFAVCRLTPDKYHYNHLPVSGRVADIYEVDGRYHSCNPLASVSIASIHSKNRRVITIIDTDVEGGSQVGLVAMVEVVALMIGDIRQAYSTWRYSSPEPVRPGLFLRKGCPKSLYRPGSSTDVVIFEPDRIEFCPDLVMNSRRSGVHSRFTGLTCGPLVETDIKVRSPLARRKDGGAGLCASGR
ncbi:MAG: phosphatidylserine decarboxylase [Desulfocapsaceae bacterium]|nr:phosphatidylserine decarboxylase [Desulfocapsaceae bacterium]